MKGKGTERLAEIRDGWYWRLFGIDAAFLAGQLYRQQNGNSLSLRNARDQHHGFISDWPGLCFADRKNPLESELAILDPNWFHRRLHDIFQLRV